MSAAETIRKLGDQVESLIYHTKHWNDSEAFWYVQLKHVERRDEQRKVQIEVSAEDVDLDKAIEEAWMKLEAELADLSPIVLKPAIEHQAKSQLEYIVEELGLEELKPSPPEPKSPALDDEIPF